MAGLQHASKATLLIKVPFWIQKMNNERESKNTYYYFSVPITGFQEENTCARLFKTNDAVS